MSERTILKAGVDHPLGKLEPQPWIDAPETQAVMAALDAQGDMARFVGGCVRDAILKKQVNDVDIATKWQPKETVSRLEAAGIKAVPTGIKHGTITAVINRKPFEITTLRKDVETDGRHAQVEFTDDWMADASRRDFTMNALTANLDGDVFDPFHGLAHMAEGTVRFVGVPEQRIDEDVLRLLRFFRFNAYYGRPPYEPRALHACRAMAYRLKELSGERVREEMRKILLCHDPADMMQLMIGERVLEHIFPNVKKVGTLRLLSWLETRAIVVEGVQPNWIRRMAALLGADEKQAGDVAERLRLSNADRDRLLALVKARNDDESGTLSEDISEDELRRQLVAQGAERVRDRALLVWAQKLSIMAHLPREKTDRWISMMEYIGSWVSIEFPLRGRDIAALGVPKGPEIGRHLKEVRAWWERGGCRADHDACIAHLKQTVTK